MNKIVDLHIHTTASDGSYTPSGVVELASKTGLSAIAITDHDTVDGVSEAVIAAEKIGIELVPGVEISVGETDNMHIIGLFVDINNSGFQSVMDNMKANRRDRNELMISKLKNEGFDISYEKIQRLMGAKNMGRLHIASYFQLTGVVNDYRKILRSYLIPGTPAYVPIKHLSEEEGISAIIKGGGIPILAHINYLKMEHNEIEATVKRLMNYGLLGVEAYYTGYDKKTEAFAHNLCERLGLLKSGGTDFHGSRRPGVYLGNGKGNICVPYEYLSAIKQKRG